MTRWIDATGKLDTMELTPEQKAEAEAKAKAETQAKKDAATKSKSDDSGKDDADDEDDEEEDAPDAAKLTATNKKLRDENAKRRVEAKELKEKLERQEKALAILQGKEKPELDPLEQAQKQANERLRRATLKATLATVARDAHDPALLLTSFPSAFAEVEVDVDNETVDEEQLEAVVEGLRKKRPYLFATADTKTQGTDKKFVKVPKGGPPQTGTNHTAEWKQLKAAGDKAGAQAYYTKNRAAILAELKNQG